MEYPTFASLIRALEVNNLLLKAAVYSVKITAESINESIMVMKENIQRLEKCAVS